MFVFDQERSVGGFRVLFETQLDAAHRASCKGLSQHSNRKGFQEVTFALFCSLGEII